MKKNILLTFDYELFQGKRSGTVKNCLLLPTEKILALLSKHKVIAIFFVDTLYLHRLKEIANNNESAKRDFILIETQLIKIANQGHYVFNHIHPHWLDAEYIKEKNQWQLINDSKYAFQSLSENEREIVFEMTMNLLNEILRKSSKSFPANGYRAGGLYIQPFSIFEKYFQRYSMKYDFSVLVNAYGRLQNNNAGFDFSNVKKNIYQFSNSVTEEDKNGSYTEYALRFIDIPLLFRLKNSIFYRFFSHSGIHQRSGDGVATLNKISTTEKKWLASNETFSIEMLNEVKLPLYVKEVQNEKYLHLLSHPKLVSEYNLKVFDHLLQKLAKIGDCEYDFTKFMSI